MNAPQQQQTEAMITAVSVESILENSRSGLTIAELADDIGVSAKDVKAALKALNDLGKIDVTPAKNPNDNRYSLIAAPKSLGGTDSEGGELDIRADDEVDAEMPPADPVLLASANRMLAERLAGVAHALRGSGLDGLKDIDDGADLQMAVAALTGAYQMALTRIADLEIVAAAFDDLQQEMVDVADLSCGYIVVASKRKPRRFQSEDKAREAAKSAIRAGAQRAEVFPLASPIGRAVKGAVWRPA